jgi:carotenoid cleavage dioxygenase-like enzyme
VNAQTNGNTITAELWRTPRLVFNPETDGRPFPPHLYRWTIDLDEGTLHEEQLDDTPAEFGRIDPRQAGKDYKHLYSLGSLGLDDMRGEPDGFNCIFRYDMKTGGRTAHELPRHDSTGEPIFVPRTPDSDEGDGFVISVVHRATENRSDVIVLDAQNIEAAPLATVHLPNRVPYCFHGSWLQGASLA